MLTTLTIDGTPYDNNDRAAAQIELDYWSWDLDGDLAAEFHETRSGPNIAPRFHVGQPVQIETDTGTGDVMRFTGEIATVVPTFVGHGWVYGYLCLGPKFQANQLWVTGTDGTGVLVFNLPPDDPEYVPANSGLSVGDIIDAILTLHASALTAIGVTTDATTTSQLAALTVVPNEPVYLTGRVADVIQNLLDRWARNVRSHINADGLYRFYDTTAASTTLTLTMNLDPIDPVCFQRDARQCASRIVVRGKGKIYPGYVSIGRGSLTAAWTGGDQSAWSYTDFSQPSDAYDTGTVISVDSPTQVTVQSADAAKTWAVNFWNNRQAWIYLSSSIGTALTYSEQRPVTACAALSAGGNATVTLGFDLENAGASAYDQYELIGKVADLASGGLNNVWRLYDVTDPGGQIADHLVPKFPAQVPFLNASGTAESLTWYPVATIINGLNAWPATFKVLPLTGQILFDEPVVKPFNSPATLNTGGGAVTAPDDIYALLAYSRGALTATYPADVAGNPVYDGTSYTADGIERTLYLDVESWVYQGNQSLMDQYAEMIWKAYSDTVVTGSIDYRGAYTDAFDPDLKLNVAGDGFTTGMESVGVPVRAFRLRYHPDGSAGLNYSSSLRCSSQRNPITGDSLYLHTTQMRQAGFSLNLGGMLNMRGLGEHVMANWASSARASKLAAGAAQGMGSLATGAALGMGSLAAGAAGTMTGMAAKATAALGGPNIGGDVGPIWMGSGNGAPPSKRHRKGSYAAARKQWQEEAAERMEENKPYYTSPESVDGKKHTFTGVAPKERKRKLTRAQAQKEWQQQAQQRAAQQPPVDAGDVGGVVGVDNVEGAPNGSQAPPSRDGKKHTFTGAKPKRPSRKIGREEAIALAQQAAHERQIAKTITPASVEKGVARRDRAASHRGLRSRRTDDEESE